MVHRTSQSLSTNFQLITNNQQIIRHMKLKKKLTQKWTWTKYKMHNNKFVLFSFGFKNIIKILTLELNRSQINYADYYAYQNTILQFLRACFNQGFEIVKQSEKDPTSVSKKNNINEIKYK